MRCGEEYAEGLFRPALQRMTYDPEAVYDNEWLNDTLYDTAVGAVLGGLGGGVGAVTGRTAAENAPKIAVEQRPAAKQENFAPNVEAESANYDDLQANLILDDLERIAVRDAAIFGESQIYN